VKYLKKLYNWIKSFFVTSYTVHVSYDSQWGNQDDKIFYRVKTIQKSTFKELKFIDENKKLIHIKSESGLNYRIEEE